MSDAMATPIAMRPFRFVWENMLWFFIVGPPSIMIIFPPLLPMLPLFYLFGGLPALFAGYLFARQYRTALIPSYFFAVLRQARGLAHCPPAFAVPFSARR